MFIQDSPSIQNRTCPARGPSPQLTTRQTIIVDPAAIADGQGVMAGIGQTVSLSDVDWKDFSAKLKSALQSKPEQYLLLRGVRRNEVSKQPVYSTCSQPRFSMTSGT